MRNILKALLFVSAFSPALVSVGLSRLASGSPPWNAVYYILAGAAGSLTVLYVLSVLRWHGETFAFSPKKIESYDAVLLGIVATYILPFFLKAPEVTVGAIIALLGLLFFVSWFSDATVPSPLVRVLGFRFYKAEGPNGMVYTLITNREVLDPSNVTTVKKISGSMLLEVGR